MQASIDRTETFRALHREGCFVIPNPWDVGSARLLAGLGFKALATTSSGFAWTLGKSDNHVTLDEALEHLRIVAGSVDVPVNADFEGGFAVEPDGVAANVARAVETGVAGLSIEDSSGDPATPLFDFDLSVARIRAARQAIDDHGGRVLLTGRSEGFVVGRPDLAETIRRLRAYADAGADCLYAPRLGSLDDIAAVVRSVAPKPVNVLVGSDFTTVAALADLGVRRISVGGGLARVAWGAFLQAATEIAEHGTFTGLAKGIPFAEIDGAFAQQTQPAVLVLGRDTCEDTTRSRALLARLGIAFTYLKVDEDAAADRWIRRLNDGGWRTPTILIGDPDRPDAILREPSDEELLAALRLA